MKKFKLSVIIIMVGTLLSKVLGLAREVLLAQKYGTGYISDSFILSLNIPNVLICSFAGAILTNYMPVLSQIEKESKEKVKKFNGNLLNISLFVSIIIIIIFMIFSKSIVKLFAVGFDEKGLTYLINISRITIFSMYFILAAHIFKGHLEYKGKFFGTALYGILMNIGMILGIVFSSTEKYVILGYGVLAGYILSFLTLLILSKKNGFKTEFNIDIRDQYIKKIAILTLPMILNDAVWQINGIVDKSIASTVGAGYISAINYAHYIVDMVSSVFATSVVTVFFPNVVKTFTMHGIEVVKEKTRTILKTIILITIPCTILIAFFAKTIVKVLFFRGAFNEESLSITYVAVAIYSIALIFVCLKTILFKVFYAMQDTKTPTKSAIIAILCNIILTLLLVKPLGYIGIIVATIIASIISTILLFMMFKQKNGTLLNKEFLVNIFKIIVASIIMLLIMILLNLFIKNIFIYNELLSEIIQVAIIGIISIISYIVSLYVMKYNFKLK